jgi:MYXO-CTERM domain-containing protein
MRLVLLSAAALALTPVAAFAQTTTEAGAPIDATAVPATQQDEDEFPWGLLGLLGLAGLLGAKRRDDRHDTRRA